MAARRIDVELVELASQEDDVGSVIKVGSSVSVERRESGLVCCFSGRALGAVPAQHHAALAEADFSGTIRSVRRGGPEPKTLTSILVRFTPATGSTQGAGVKQDASRVPPEQRLIQELQADEFRHLSRAQLESLVDSAPLRAALKGNKALQAALTRIDSSQDRRQALEQALQDPAFATFAETVLSTAVDPAASQTAAATC